MTQIDPEKKSQIRAGMQRCRFSQRDAVGAAHDGRISFFRLVCPYDPPTSLFTTWGLAYGRLGYLGTIFVKVLALWAPWLAVARPYSSEWGPNGTGWKWQVWALR